MKRFVEGSERTQGTLFPDHLEDFVDENNAVRVIDAFVDALDLVDLGFVGAVPAATGRPGYHPAVLLKITCTAISIAFIQAGVSRRRRVATLI